MNWNIFKKEDGWLGPQARTKSLGRESNEKMECVVWKWTSKHIHIREKERSPD